MSEAEVNGQFESVCESVFSEGESQDVITLDTSFTFCWEMSQAPAVIEDLGSELKRSRSSLMPQSLLQARWQQLGFVGQG